jgi:hypothetical protein
MKIISYRKYFILAILAILVWFSACVNAPDFSDIPEIEFISLSDGTMEQGFFETDSVLLVFSFTDGDGDIGIESTDPGQDIFIIDNRTGNIYDRFKTPFVPLQGVNNGIQGEVRIKLFTTCCIFPEEMPPCTASDEFPSNDLSFDIYMIDRAGNESNRITTPMIQLLCN